MVQELLLELQWNQTSEFHFAIFLKERLKTLKNKIMQLLRGQINQDMQVALGPVHKTEHVR